MDSASVLFFHHRLTEDTEKLTCNRVSIRSDSSVVKAVKAGYCVQVRFRPALCEVA